MKPRLDNPGIPVATTKRLVVWSVLLLPMLCLPCSACAPDGPAGGAASVVSDSSPAIVVGFVGGFVRPGDMRHAEVQLAHELSAIYGRRIHSEIFDNRHQKDAYLTIRRWLDTDDDGDLSNAERRASHIVLYGHSWGAAAVLSLARELQAEKIPVLLTVQVDSIHKIGQDDRVIPANVAGAVNFYQTHGLLHGRPEIAAADPSRTRILGQFRFDYTRMPLECRDYPWLDRHLFKGHTSIECDPRVWSQVRDLIETALPSGTAESVDSRMESPTQAAQPETAGRDNLVQQLSPSQLMQR